MRELLNKNVAKSIENAIRFLQKYNINETKLYHLPHI